jgi:hypothetical protein
MRKLTMTLTAAALMLGTMAISANAQTAAGAASLHAQIHNATMFRHAACNGFTGGCGCAPGWISACANRCCRCVRCY